MGRVTRKGSRSLVQATFVGALFPNSTLADLYDVDVMPRELRKAHRDLDAAIDKLYRSAAFSRRIQAVCSMKTRRDRVKHLFGLYEKLIAPVSGG